MTLMDIIEYGDMEYAARHAIATGHTRVMIDPAHAIELIAAVKNLQGCVKDLSATSMEYARTNSAAARADLLEANLAAAKLLGTASGEGLGQDA